MELDSAEVRGVAAQFAAAADLVDGAVRNQLAQLAFDGFNAGRAHASHGDAVRIGLGRLAAELAQWSRAAMEIAVALRSGASRYTDADLSAAARIA